MSIRETVEKQIDTNRRGHFRDCELLTPDVCSCDVKYGEIDNKVGQRKYS